MHRKFIVFERLENLDEHQVVTREIPINRPETSKSYNNHISDENEPTRALLVANVVVRPLLERTPSLTETARVREWEKSINHRATDPQAAGEIRLEYRSDEFLCGVVLLIPI